MTESERNEWVTRLAQRRNRDLFSSLLGDKCVSYEGLAKSADRNVGALITQFSRWRSRGLDLLSEVRSNESTVGNKSRGQGRPKETFSLKEEYRPLISDVLTALESAKASEPLEYRDNLPNLDEIAARLDKAHDESLDLSIRYYSAKAASSRYQELLDFVSDTQSEHLGYQPSSVLLFRLNQGVSRAEHVADQVRQSIAIQKIEDVSKRHLSVLNHVANNVDEKARNILAPYFGDMEERSVSGYGGALFARSEGNKCAVLDDFLELHFQSMEPLGGKMKFGFQHVLGEAIELAKIEDKWMPLTKRLLAGAAVCPPLFELPGLRRTIESSLGKISVTTRDTEGELAAPAGASAKEYPRDSYLEGSDFVEDAQEMLRSDVVGHRAQEQGGLMAKIHAASPSLAARIKAVVEPVKPLDRVATL